MWETTREIFVEKKQSAITAEEEKKRDKVEWWKKPKSLFCFQGAEQLTEDRRITIREKTKVC